MYRIITVLLVMKYVANFYIPAGNDTAEEEQHAICHITTKELEATANATISRRLKGVCTSDDFHSRINKLEDALIQKINNLIDLLHSNTLAKVDNKINLKALKSTKQANKTFSDNQPKTYKVETDSDSFENIETSTKNIESLLKPRQRTEEIYVKNDTVQYSNGKSIYIFYWNIDNIHNLLTKFDMYKSSPNFFILGHSLQLQLYPNSPEDHYFSIQLKPINKGFIKKHKIFIINQYKSELDIDSGMLYGTKNDHVMLTLSLDHIKSEGYIVNDKIIVGLQIYLDS